MDSRKEVGLPPRPFLYTLDQIATLIDVSVVNLKDRYLFFDGRSVGARPKDRMFARNIAAEGETPDWRVMEQELIRWLKAKRFRLYERGW